MTDTPTPFLAVPSGGETPPPADQPIAQPRSGHRARWIALGVGLVAVAMVVAFAVVPPANDRPVQSPLIGHPAPPVNGPSVTPYPFASLNALQGRWVLVNFFATWCVP